MRTGTRLATLALAVMAGAAPVMAQGVPELAPGETMRRTGDTVVVRAVRITEPLSLDGRLDEAPYQEIAPINGFVQQEPNDGQPATEDTDVWVLFDDETLYVSTRNWDSQPERMVENEMRHDSNNLIRNEQITIILDTFDDDRNGFLFLVNSLGGMLEEVFANEGNPSRDWNTVWDAATGRFDGGWTLETAIPFKSLRYEPGAGNTWGIQLNRIIMHKNENTYLAPVPVELGQGVFRVSRAATLVGLETPPLAKNVEIKPYAIGSVATDRLTGVDNDPDGDVGVDVKVGLTGSLTADFTVNTDFAQVESDEQQVNLTRFSLFFPEKREFFLEGQSIFNFGGVGARGGGDVPVMFFSRQVGLQGGQPVPIIGGGRVTGRAGDFDLGVMNIQTASEDDLGAPSTNFTALRARRGVFNARSTVGAIFTRRSQSLVADGSNETWGIDAQLRPSATLQINTFLAGTRTPDFEGDALSYRGQVDWSTDRYGASFSRLSVGENFNPEVGFVRRRDFDSTSATLRFSPRPAGIAAIRQFSYQTDFTYLTDRDGRLVSRDGGLSFRTTFQNSDTINVSYSRQFEQIDRPFRVAGQATVGVGGYGFQSFNASYTLGQQRRVSGTLSTRVGEFYDGTQQAVGYSGRIAVATRLALEPSIQRNWIELPTGTFTTDLVSTRITAPLTPRMFVSALLQYNSSNASFSNNVRLRWEYEPGSELFVVYSEGRDTSLTGFPDLQNRSFVVKVNRLFRL
jgi:hypothetical protein